MPVSLPFRFSESRVRQGAVTTVTGSARALATGRPLSRASGAPGDLSGLSRAEVGSSMPKYYE